MESFSPVETGSVVKAFEWEYFEQIHEKFKIPTDFPRKVYVWRNIVSGV